MTTAHIKALDLFAGTGWGVACQRLGIKEAGVEIMPEAIATRTANGMETIYHDVWDGLLLTAEQHREQYGSYGLLIASPPCQTFSMAGKGSGRAALDEVLEAIELHAYKDAAALLEFGEKHDMRTALVLSPLAYVWRDRPKLVAFEQVPTVLPVWEACAEVMREWGYEVKVEVLRAEQYGVPQTRNRAILVARRGGPVSLPMPTHSRYYSRTPKKLDAGVKKWVSMADALGWGMTERPSMTLTGGQNGGGSDPMSGGSGGRARIAHERDEGRWIAKDEKSESRSYVAVTVEEASALQSYPTLLRSNYGTGGDASNRGERTIDQPAPTLTSKADRNKWDGQEQMSADQAGTLQTYEKPFVWCGSKSKQFLQIGNAVPPLLAEHILAALIGITEGR